MLPSTFICSDDGLGFPVTSFFVAAVTIQLYVEAGRIRTRVAGVDIGAVTVPATPVQTQFERIKRLMEEQANRIAAAGLTGTALKIINLGASSTGLLVDLGP